MLTLDYLNSLDSETRLREIIKETKKCKQDPIYCIETYFSITDAETGNKIPARLYPYQIKAIRDFESYNYNLSMKSRQMGFTTVSALYCAWFMGTKQNMVVNALANKLKTSVKFLKTVRDVLDNARKVAPWLIPHYVDNDNAKISFTLKNGCSIKAESNNEDACRGETINLLIIDEVAAIDRSNPERMSEIWSSAGITLTRSKGKCIGISCVTKDTYVFTDQGLQQVEDFIPYNIDSTIKQGYYLESPYKVLGKEKLRESNLFYCNGLSDIYKITTPHTELKGSEKHKMWTYDSITKNYKIKQFKDLLPTDYINTQYGFNQWGNNNDISDFQPLLSSSHRNIFIPTKLTPDLCYLIGLYISEGNAYKVIKNNKIVGGTVTISCGDDISSVFDSLGLKYYNYSYGIGKTICSLTFVLLLEHLGFDLSCKAHEKYIPKRLLQCSKENIQALLQGIFDGDGSSSSTTGTVSLASSSITLIEQVKMLLLNFGCLSSTYKTTKEYLNENLPTGWYKFKHDTYNLQLGRTSSFYYYKHIGFRLERKQSNKNLLSNFGEQYEYTVPGGSDIVKKLYTLTSLSPWKLATYKKIYIPFTSKTNIKIQQLIDLIVEEDKKLKQHPYILYLQDKVLIPNSVWVKIKNISIEEKQDYTYDFSLPQTEDFWCHSVVYNGLLGEQTPKGSSGWYFEQYTNADTNGWNIIEAHWSEHPIYSQGSYQYVKDDNHLEGGYIKYFNETWPIPFDKVTTETYKTKETYNYIRDGRLRSPWYDVESKKLGIQRTRCELDCSFAGSGSEVLDPEVIRTIAMFAKDFPPLSLEETHIPTSGIWKSYKQFKHFNPAHGYLISADVSTGDGSDFSGFVVVDITAHEVVATYKDQIEPLAYAKILDHIGKKFGNCLLIVENQGPGLTTLLELKNLGYPNIFYHTLKKADVTKTQKRKLGFWQGEQSRLLGGDRLEEDLNTNQLKVYSQDIITELHTWIWDKDGKRRHAPGKNDDLLMALANAMFYIYYVATRKANTQNMMRQHLQVISNKFVDDLIDYKELINDTDETKHPFTDNGRTSSEQYEKLKLWNLNKRS